MREWAREIRSEFEEDKCVCGHKRKNHVRKEEYTRRCGKCKCPFYNWDYQEKE